jgi:hypothetical protein
MTPPIDHDQLLVAALMAKMSIEAEGSQLTLELSEAIWKHAISQSLGKLRL